MFTEQRIRVVLYYSSLLIFFLGLPFILSFALGYKFDRSTMKFTQTGLIYIKTQPPGASIYINEGLINDKTPVAIRELLPGSYHVRVELPNYYPWSGEVGVGPRKAALLEKIILFPLRPNIEQVNKDKFNVFLVEEAKGVIYYINYEDNGIYASDLNGSHYKKISSFIGISPPSSKWKFSPDNEKIVYFNKHKIGVTYSNGEREKKYSDKSFVLDYPQAGILDVFWHSDNYHLIVISDRNIEVLEAHPETNFIELVKLNKRNVAATYNFHEDTLYFVDSQRVEDGSVYNNLYKIDLTAKALIFPELIKIKKDE